jgi:hypothetical protein
MAITTTTRAIGAHLGNLSFICFSSIILLLDVANIGLEGATLLGGGTTSVHGHRIQLAQSGKLSILGHGTIDCTMPSGRLGTHAVSQRRQFALLEFPDGRLSGSWENTKGSSSATILVSLSAHGSRKTRKVVQKT